jgi:hypothetical protein
MGKRKREDNETLQETKKIKNETPNNNFDNPLTVDFIFSSKLNFSKKGKNNQTQFRKLKNCFVNITCRGFIY